MDAVIRTGGKQYRVTPGQRLEVELLGSDVDAELSLAPLMLIDGETVLATPAQLSKASVRAKVVGEAKGPKINGFKYKSKSNQRKRWGHRQHYSVIEITGISAG